MKHFPFILILFSLILASCGGEKKALDALVAERDSLKTVQSDVASKLMELDEQISLLDSSLKLTQISAFPIQTSLFEHYFSAQANLESEYNALIFPEIQGVVTEIYAEEGQTLTKGQRILQLDTELIRKSIAEVETQYQLATELYNRQQNLWEQNIGSEVQYLQARTNKEALENSLSTLRKQLSMGTVTAPFSGTLDEIMPRIGEMASPGMPVARVVSLKDLYVKADVSESYLKLLNEGMSAEVVFPGIDTVAAEVSRIGSYINPENRSFKVRVDLKENSPYLKPNLFATLRIRDFVTDSAVVLPAGAILQDYEGKNYVFTVNESGGSARVTKRIIETGLSYEGMTHVTSGLSQGDRIVDKGARKVVDGEVVRIMISEEPELKADQLP